MSERTVKIDVLSWKTKNFSPWSPRAKEYLGEFEITPEAVNTWGLTKNSAWIGFLGLQIQGYWPDGFDWERFKVLAELEPHNWEYSGEQAL